MFRKQYISEKMSISERRAEIVNIWRELILNLIRKGMAKCGVYEQSLWIDKIKEWFRKIFTFLDYFRINLFQTIKHTVNVLTRYSKNVDHSGTSPFDYLLVSYHKHSDLNKRTDQ